MVIVSSQILVFISHLEIPQQPSKQPLESKAQVLVDVEYPRLSYHNLHIVIPGVAMGLLMIRPWMYKHIIFHSLVSVFIWVMISMLEVVHGRVALSL